MDAEIVTPTLRIIVEFKFCPISKTKKRSNPLRALLRNTPLAIGASSLRALKVTNMGTDIKTVADLRRSAIAQVKGYARGLSPEKQQEDEAKGRSLVGFAVSQIGTRFAVDEFALD